MSFSPNKVSFIPPHTQRSKEAKSPLYHGEFSVFQWHFKTLSFAYLNWEQKFNEVYPIPEEFNNNIEIYWFTLSADVVFKPLHVLFNEIHPINKCIKNLTTLTIGLYDVYFILVQYVSIIIKSNKYWAISPLEYKLQYNISPYWGNKFSQSGMSKGM